MSAHYNPNHDFREIDTPALIVDLDIMETNIRQMASMAAKNHIKLRPHIKTHKSPWIAKAQIAAGAVGITVAKLGEAETMLEAGIHDILLAYPIVGAVKLRRLEHLLRQTPIILSTDSLPAAVGMAEAAARAGQVARFYVDVDTGLQRLGLAAGEEAAHLALAIAGLPHSEVLGLMSHAGHVGSAGSPTEVEALATKAAKSLLQTADICRSHGLEIRDISPGSTVGAAYEALVPGVTELRPGTYVFNDANTVRRWAAAQEDCAVTVLATVVSCPSSTRAVIDAGSKTLSSDQSVSGSVGYGIVVGRPALEIERISEEHGVLRLPEGSAPLSVGERLAIIPNHVCPVVNLSDTLYGMRNGLLEREIAVSARGKNR